MQIDGFHQLFYLVTAAFVIYAIMVINVWLGFYEADHVGVKKRPKLHASILFIGILLILFQPFKLVSQSSGEREFHRHSFDTPVYQNNRPAVETFNPSNELGSIKRKQDEARAEWDQLKQTEEK